jgi:predicted Zn-dependent protease
VKRWWFAVVLAACHHAREAPLVPLSREAYAHYLAGRLALYQDDAGTAADELAAASAAAPDEPMIVVEQARALAKAHRIDEAERVLEAARLKWPDHEQIWLVSGELLEKNDADDAVRAYQRAIALEPSDERPYLGVARVELELHHPRRAEAILRKLVLRVPASVDGRYRLAQRLSARGALSDAVTQLRAVIERDPDHLDARLDLARALRRSGDLAQAIAQTRSAFDRAGQPVDIAEELFGLLCEADDLQGAIDLLTLLDDDRSDAETLAIVARLNIGLGRLDVAARIGQHLDAMEPQLASLVRVELALAHHDLAAAEKAAAAIHAGTPAFAQARRQLADAAMSAGDTAHARELIAPLIESEADRAFVEARIRAREHDTTAALALLSPILREHPDEVAALNIAGYLLADAHTRLADAERYLRHARELAPGDPAVLDSWGWLMLAEGKRGEGLRALEQAARLAPLDPEILAHRDAARRAARDTMKP